MRRQSLARLYRCICITLICLVVMYDSYAMDPSHNLKENNSNLIKNSQLQESFTSKEQNNNTKTKRAKLTEQYADRNDITLKPIKISQNKKGNYFWRIFYLQNSAGKVSIEWKNSPFLKEHASIQISINKKYQGLRIGRIAYEQSCLLSPYDTVFALMRKNNIPSYKAAFAAGFQETSLLKTPQRIMKWCRPKV